MLCFNYYFLLKTVQTVLDRVRKMYYYYHHHYYYYYYYYYYIISIIKTSLPKNAFLHYSFNMVHFFWWSMNRMVFINS